MSTFYIVEGVNLFCGDHDPTNSKHLTLAELKLPDLTGIFADHHPGGARVGVEFEVGIEKLQPTFKLNGYDPDLLVQFGLGSRVRHMYTGYGALVDKRTGAYVELKTVMEARLGEVTPDAFQRGELMGHEYALKELMHYEVHFNGSEKIYWDFFTNTWRVNGTDQNADVNRILRISGAG
jgi:Phage tail tube protein FII